MPKGYPVRPTPDKIKEALFNIIPPVEGKRFLDLYAGAGCVGLEALSRGALRAVFVEREPALVHAIRKNIQTCGFSDLAEVISADVKRGIGRLSRQGESFHVLFADPPYDRGLVGETLQMLKESQIMSDDVLVIIQHSVRESSAEIFRDDRLVIADQRRYGDTALSFMRYS